MKTGTKKFLYTIFAVILALGLGIGAILLSMLNVQASTEMMPGIEQILDEKSEETPFRLPMRKSVTISPGRSHIFPNTNTLRQMPMERKGRHRLFLL